MRITVRRTVRLTRMVSLLFLGLGITFVVFPFTDRARHRQLISRWSGALMRACGVTVRAQLSPNAPNLATPGADQGYLLLANHISWLDIFVINQHSAARFVAKSEIARWPVIGTLVSRVGTLFIERGRRRAVHGVLHQVAEHLHASDVVAVFPEGMISPGDYLLPFHGNLVQAAISASRPVVPVGLRYCNFDGEPSAAMLYVGDMSFIGSVWRILGEPGLVAQLHVLDPIVTSRDDKRHLIAAQARDRLSQVLGLGQQDTVPESLRNPTA